MGMQVNMLEAKNHLSKLVKAAVNGQEVVIASNGVPMVRLVRVSARGKLSLPEGSLGEAIETQGFPVLAITARHVDATPRFERSLPDPFDRLLLATAFEEGMLLMTQDAAILDLSKRIKLPVAEVH